MYSANRAARQQCDPSTVEHCTCVIFHQCHLPIMQCVNHAICQPSKLIKCAIYLPWLSLRVEKGRQIAGIILDSWARGRRKHVWFR